MRLDEFYTPEEDNQIKVKSTDTRKPRLTLLAINKLRQIKNIKQAEEKDHLVFVKKMYGPAPAEDAGF